MRAFRELFPFSQPHAEKTAAELRERLDTVSGLSSYEVVVELTLHVIPGIAKQPNLHMRFKLLEETLEEAEKALPVLERHVDYSELPLTHAAKTSALAADNLIKTLAAGYHGIARDIAKGASDLGGLLQRVIRRAMTLVVRRQQLAYRSYSKPSNSSWSLLHDLFQMARKDRKRRPQENLSQIEHLYLSALLFAYLEPSKLPRSELAAAIFCTQQLARHARIVDIIQGATLDPKSTIGFLVLADEGSPGTPLHRIQKSAARTAGLIIDCAAVFAAIEESVKRSSEGATEPGLDIPQELLHALQIAISGKSTRRFDRKAFRPRADIVGGIAQVIPFIEGNAHTRRADDSIGRIGHKCFVPSEWSLIDQSPDGFLVRFLQGEKWRVGIGNIIALQPRESNNVHVCLVRRIATSRSGLLELGLQLLAPEVSIIDLPSHGECRRGILLHSLPAFGGQPGIIARPGYLSSGHRLHLKESAKPTSWIVGKRLEGSEGVEFFGLLPLPG